MPAPGARRVAGATVTSWRERSSSRRARSRPSRALLGPRDAEHEHPPPRRPRARRGAARAAAGSPSTRRDGVAQRRRSRRSCARASPSARRRSRASRRAGGTGPGASASRRRPAVSAVSTIPLPQRRRAMCQTQPASVRSSRGQRRRGALEGVVAARGAAAVERRARRARATRASGARAPVVDPRGRDVADPPAGGAQPPLPVLLVAGAAERGVEAPDPLQRAAPHRQVGAPRELRVAVLRAEVERGQRQRLAPARVQPAALQPRPDRPAERLVVRVRAGGGQQRVQPARPRLDVVVEEAQQLAGGGVERRVAGDVDPARLAVREVARRRGAVTSRSVSGSAGSSSTTTISAPCAAACARHGRERHREVVAAAAGGEEERGGRASRGEEPRLSAPP